MKKLIIAICVIFSLSLMGCHDHKNDPAIKTDIETVNESSYIYAYDILTVYVGEDNVENYILEPVDTIDGVVSKYKATNKDDQDDWFYIWTDFKG